MPSSSRDLRAPALPMGTMSFADDAPISDELHAKISSLVIKCIQGQVGIPHSAVVSYVLLNLKEAGIEDLGMAIDDFIFIIGSVIGGVIDAGNITRLSYKAENVSYNEYYPKDTVFQVTPARNVLEADRPSAPENLDPTDLELFSNLQLTLGWAYRNHPNVMKRLIMAFCPRCGAPVDGHYCPF